MKENVSTARNSKKWMFYVSIFFFAVIVLLSGVIYSKHDKREQMLMQMLINKGNTYEEVKSEKIGYKIPDKKNLKFSNLYLNKSGKETQIRMQVTYAYPFLHANFFNDTGFTLMDSKGNSLNAYSTAYSDSYLGRNGMHLVFTFSEETTLPKKGETLKLTICSTEGGSNMEKEASYAYGEVEWTMP